MSYVAVNAEILEYPERTTNALKDTPASISGDSSSFVSENAPSVFEEVTRQNTEASKLTEITTQEPRFEIIDVGTGGGEGPMLENSVGVPKLQFGGVVFIF